MEKLKMESEDVLEEKAKKIAELFPDVVTEGVSSMGGGYRHLIDFDALKQELTDVIVEGSEERYQFTWPDKKKARLLVNTPVKATLRPCKEESVNFDTTQNLYIEGDNLDVLKLLRETYLGKIKMIYIDPPYNTGNDFIYEDKFAMSVDEYNEVNGEYDDQGNRLIQNPTENGRFHTDWLNMIYPRLKVARDLLSDDGIIFISMDDHEQANLKKICDEIYGESNFITKFIWEKTQHFGRQKLNSYSNADYILCYAKNLVGDKLKELLVERINTDLVDAPLFNASNNVNTLHFPKGTVKFNLSDGIYESTSSSDYVLKNAVIVKDGINDNDFGLSFKSRWSDATVQEEIKNGTTFWVKTTSFAIRAIYGDSKWSTVAPKQILFTNSKNDFVARSRHGIKIDTSEKATGELIDLLGSQCFPYPKPVSLIEYLIELLYDENSGANNNDSIILDFFSGSATTAHAVMHANAMDGGNRKYIMVQVPDLCGENSEAYKAGYKNICEIGKERIRRAGKKIKEDSGLMAQDLDIGMRVLKLDSSNMKDVYYSPDQTSQQSIEDMLSNVKEDRTPMDLLFQVMLETDVLLSSKIDEKEIEGKKVFIVNDNDLICCFDSDIGDDVVKAIAQMKPLYAVFRDSSFSSDSPMVNAEQYFRTYSPDTQCRII